MTFSKTQYRTYQNDKKGFIGEKIFATMIKKKLKTPHLALHSLFFEQSNYFQPDCILLIPNQLHLLEIKNYEGEFEFKEDYLHSITSRIDYPDPVEQVKRGKLLLSKMLPGLNIPLQIQSHVIFVNSSFTLFHAERDPYIILPTQLKSYFHTLNNVPGDLPVNYEKYREQLEAQHLPKSPFTKFPNYSYDELQKGVLCRNCRRSMKLRPNKLYCVSYSSSEKIDSGILRMILEFHLLFPDSNITTGIIYNWCGEVVSAKTIKRILGHYLKIIFRGRSTHYIFYNTFREFQGNESFKRDTI